MNTKQLQFILARAACLLVEAYTKCIAEYRNILPLDDRIGLDAPSTYEGLKADAREGFLKVSTEHNSSSIYGLPVTSRSARSTTTVTCCTVASSPPRTRWHLHGSNGRT